MENCVAPGLDAFDVLLQVVLSLVRVQETEHIKIWYCTGTSGDCSAAENW